MWYLRMSSFTLLRKAQRRALNDSWTCHVHIWRDIWSMQCLFACYLLKSWLHILYLCHYTAWTLFGLKIPSKKKKKLQFCRALHFRDCLQAGWVNLDLLSYKTLYIVTVGFGLVSIVSRKYIHMLSCQRQHAKDMRHLF